MVEPEELIPSKLMILAEIELATVLLGVISSFITAVAYLYKDMRKDMEAEKVRCAYEISKLFRELEELRNGPCIKKDCPLNQQK